METQMDHAVRDMIGRRSEQQDSARVAEALVGDQPGLLIIVADGMGGAVGGQVASTVATRAFEEDFLGNPNQAIDQRLNAALEAANAAIAAEVRRDRGLDGMGCTMIGVFTDGRHTHWISVGDSLLLVARAGMLDRLNEDHSMAAVLDRAADRGEISREEAETSHQRNVLRSALTGREVALIDRGSTILAPDSRLIAATDGLLTLPFSVTAKIACEAPGANPLATTLLAAIRADMPSDQDNVTIAVAIAGGAPPHSGPPTPRWARHVIAVGSVVFIAAVAALVVLHLHGHPKGKQNEIARPVVMGARSETPQQPEAPSPSASARTDRGVQDNIVLSDQKAVVTPQQREALPPSKVKQTPPQRVAGPTQTTLPKPAAESNPALPAAPPPAQEPPVQAPPSAPAAAAAAATAEGATVTPPPTEPRKAKKTSFWDKFWKGPSRNADAKSAAKEGS